MLAERDKNYPSRSGQPSLATAVTNFPKPVKKIIFGPSIIISNKVLNKVLKHA